ncbi:MAG: YceI family protein [Chloroflexota bacterium]|nr:YceI family protein [Chloroflexota bacterium]
MTLLRRLAALVVASVALAACGGAGAAGAVPSSPPASTSATAAGRASASTVPGALTFTVAPGSKAIVRVNEQLAGRTLPSDAVLTSDKVSGRFTLLPDGTFTPDSAITVDLAALASDQALRDNVVHRVVLQTSTYPDATFVPTKATGLPLPLPASGDLSFTLAGRMTVHGVAKDMTFDVTGTRTSGGVQVTANAAPAFPFATFGLTQPHVARVLSIKDEIRLEVDLTATSGT